MTQWYAPGIKGRCPPYEALYPCIALVSRGKFLDWWIYKYYHPGYSGFVKRGSSAQIVTKIYRPYNPRTAFQQAWRAYMYWGVKNWQSFDEETKRYYNQRVKRIGECGYHRYLSLYLKANYPPSVPALGYLLLETGDKILQESGDGILLN